jgi:colicin import membrane protein
MPDEKKKSLFDKAVDALTDRDEKAAMEKAKQEAEVAKEEAAALRVKMQAEKAGAAKAAARKAAAERAAAAKAAARAAAAPKKGTVTASSLHIRKDHSATSAEVGGLTKGEQVTILATWTDGKNTWAKLQNGWAAIVYNGETYIKLA